MYFDESGRGEGIDTSEDENDEDDTQSGESTENAGEKDSVNDDVQWGTHNLKQTVHRILDLHWISRHKRDDLAF